MKIRNILDFALGLFLGAVVATCLIFIKPGLLFRPEVLEYTEKISDDPNKIQVRIDEQVVDTLNIDYELYDIERIYCLRGGSTPEYYTITDIDIPKVLQQTETSVSFEVCSGANLIGTIHFHPSGYCILSNQDVFTFGRLAEIQNDKIHAVMCQQNTFGFYDADNLNYKNRLQWEVIE